MEADRRLVSDGTQEFEDNVFESLDVDAQYGSSTFFFIVAQVRL